jgi:hypothetical protein
VSVASLCLLLAAYALWQDGWRLAPAWLPGMRCADQDGGPSACLLLFGVCAVRDQDSWTALHLFRNAGAVYCCSSLSFCVSSLSVFDVLLLAADRLSTPDGALLGFPSLLFSFCAVLDYADTPPGFPGFRKVWVPQI